MNFFETIKFFKLNGLNDLIPEYIFSYIIEKGIGIALIVFFIIYFKKKLKYDKVKNEQKQELYKNMNEYFKNKGK